MAMRERLEASLRQAMRDKEAVRLSTLRLITAAVHERDIAARSAADDTGVDDAEIMALLGKMVKQREESANVYESGGRLELAEREREEIAIIREFLPTPLTDEETDAAIDRIIQETGASSLKDMGAVMGRLKSDYVGRIDVGSVGKRVKAKLAG